MAGTKLSEGVQEFLEAFLASYGEVTISKEDALKIYGGTKEAKVSDLTTPQLLQFALMLSQSQLTQAVALLNQGEGQGPQIQGPNRAARRSRK